MKRCQGGWQFPKLFLQCTYIDCPVPILSLSDLCKSYINLVHDLLRPARDRNGPRAFSLTVRLFNLLFDPASSHAHGTFGGLFDLFLTLTQGSHKWIHRARHHTALSHVSSHTMLSEAARDLSIPDLLRVLSEKLHLECTRLRKTHLPVVSAAELEPEVSVPQSILTKPTSLPGSDGQPFRSKASKPEHMISLSLYPPYGTCYSQSTDCPRKSSLVSPNISSNPPTPTHDRLFH